MLYLKLVLNPDIIFYSCFSASLFTMLPVPGLNVLFKPLGRLLKKIQKAELLMFAGWSFL